MGAVVELSESSESVSRKGGVKVKSSRNWKFAIVLLALSCAFVGECKGSVSPMSELVPKEMNGWKAEGQDDIYNRKTLYDYIDGGAEVYLAYGFREALARRLTKPDQPAITVDLFDMGCSEDAYGIFSFERESGDVGIGRDSEYAAGLLRFWKGVFFVSVLADRETLTSRQTVMELGKEIAQRIEDCGARPRMLSFLPSEQLIATSVCYFHKKSGLDYHYFLADENILRLGERTNAVLARYGTGDTKTRVLLVEYPNVRRAQAAFDSFVDGYIPEAKGEGSAQTENGKWVAARLKGPFVVVVLEGHERKEAESLASVVVTKMESEENERRPTCNHAP